MAADMNANDPALDPYRIDLSRLVSRYIGGIEKNLDELLPGVSDANGFLFFDEADALLG